MTYSHMANATLPSVMCRFTSEFGMGSGGTNSLWPPGKRVEVDDLLLVIKLEFGKLLFTQSVSI